MKIISCDIFRIPGSPEIPSRLLAGDAERVASRHPRIAIMIPTFRRPDLLRQTLESVLSQPEIEQAEIIVTDNFSEEDETCRMIQADFRCDNLLYYKHADNLGGDSWNRGIFFAHAPWCIMLHDDDLMLPGRLPLFLRIIDKFPNASLVGFPACDFYGNERFTREVPLPKRIRLRPLSLQEELQRNYISPCCTLFRRDHWLSVGGIDTAKRHEPCDDYYLWLYMTEKYHATWLCNAPVGAYRWSMNDSLNPVTIRRIVKRNLELQLDSTRGVSRREFLKVVSLSYEYLRKRLKQTGMDSRAVDAFYQESGFPKLSIPERLYIFIVKTATRLRQELLPAKGARDL